MAIYNMRRVPAPGGPVWPKAVLADLRVAQAIRESCRCTNRPPMADDPLAALRPRPSKTNSLSIRVDSPTLARVSTLARQLNTCRGALARELLLLGLQQVEAGRAMSPVPFPTARQLQDLEVMR